MVTAISHPHRRRPIDLRAILLAALLVLGSLLLLPGAALADGAELFGQHCAGCHVNGGNIIRRGRTLRLQALERQGLDSSAAIAAIAADGLGQMSGYGAVLGEQGVQQVADFVWQQAQLGWPRS
jgi:cytochrome c6